MIRDQYGRPDTSIHYGRDEFVATEWDDTTTSGVIYLRASDEANCLIQRVDVTHRKVTWAYGAWASRASLAYGSADSVVMRGGR